MTEFGSFLRQWRKRRHYSQLALSHAAELSARHLSFLESGRSQPSRSMVLRLVRVLDVAPAEANAGLASAGFAPVFPQCEPDDASVAMLQTAIETTLANHSPWPAIACDGEWNLMQANPAACHLLGLLGVGGTHNVVEALLIAADNNQIFLNWPEVARSLLQRLRAEALELGPEAHLHRWIRTLSQHPRLNEGLAVSESAPVDVFVPMRLLAGETELSFFSMIAQFGSVQEVTLSHVRLELFYPADEATSDYLSSQVTTLT